MQKCESEHEWDGSNSQLQINHSEITVDVIDIYLIKHLFKRHYKDDPPINNRNKKFTCANKI